MAMRNLGELAWAAPAPAAECPAAEVRGVASAVHTTHGHQQTPGHQFVVAPVCGPFDSNC